MNYINKAFFYSLIILVFPLGAIWVSHFASAIFLLVILIGLFQLKELSKLSRNEVRLIVLFALLFALMFPGALFYGWSYEQTRIIGTEIYFLAFIPVYLFIRRYMSDYNTYLKSLTITGGILGAVVMYEVLFFKHGLRSWGGYGGQMISMVAVFCFSASYLTLKSCWTVSKTWSFVALFCMIASVLVVLYSGVRGSILAAFTVSLIILLFDLKKIKLKFVFGLMIATILFTGYITFPDMRAKINRTSVAVQNYIDGNVYSKESSIGQRLEMAKSVYQIVKKAPVFGIGRRNYQQEINNLKLDGAVPYILINTNHPHSIFYTTLYGKGLLGLLVLLFIFALLLKMAYQHKNNNAGVFLGLFVVSFIITGAFDTYPLYRGVSLAFFLVTISVFLPFTADKKNDVILNNK
jgi:O-antigen ligase